MLNERRIAMIFLAGLALVATFVLHSLSAVVFLFLILLVCDLLGRALETYLTAIRERHSLEAAKMDHDNNTVLGLSDKLSKLESDLERFRIETRNTINLKR